VHVPAWHTLALTACLPTGLYVLLSLISFSRFNDFLETNYRTIYSTDFHHFFTKGHVYGRRLLILPSFSDRLRDGNQFYGQNWQNRPIRRHLSLSHSETDWNIAILMSTGFNDNCFSSFPSRFGEIRFSNTEVYEGDREQRTPLVDQQFSYIRMAASLLETAGHQN